VEHSSDNKIVLIVRSTRLDELISRFNTMEQARFYVEHLGADFSDYLKEDQVYKAAVSQAESIIARLGRLQKLHRSFLPNFIFGPQDTVVVLGQDGLVANTLKYLDGQLVLGVNPDPQRWEGVLLPFTVQQLSSILPSVFAEKCAVRTVTMAQATLNTGETLLGVNDIFIGPKTHTSARYHIKIGDQEENHSSSGIIVSTGLGSTGWLRSILAGAAGISTGAYGNEIDNQEPPIFPWDANYLQFSVREPWPSKTSGAEITFGRITPEQPLLLNSYMAENGVIFSDGIEADFLQFNAGTLATIGIADKKGTLVE
jgi:NAD kinase